MVRRILPLASIGLAIAAASPAWADPLAGEVIKFQQFPLGDTQTDPNAIYPGHDELSTATFNAASQDYTGTFASDDFSDNVTSPIVHVQWWGSYLPNSETGATVPEFLITFESNVPASSTGLDFSHPGTVLSAQTVTPGALTPGSGTFTEAAVPSVPGPDGTLYQYNAELSTPFPEVAGTTYWLKIVALNNATSAIQWGWHNRDYTLIDPYAAPPGDQLVGMNASNQPVYHYEDDAVTGDITYIPTTSSPPNSIIETNESPLLYSNVLGVDGFGVAGTTPPSEDLAFNLYYVPEPTALPLLAMGLFLFRRQRRTN